MVVHVQQPHGPPLLSGFSSFLCVEQRAEQSNGAEATDHSDTPQNCGQKWGKHGRVQGAAEQPLPAVIHHIAGEQVSLEEAEFSSQLRETAPGTCSGPLGDDLGLVTVVDGAPPRGDPKVSAAGLFETLFHVCAGLTVRAQRGDGGGGGLHSGLMMGDVCGPALKSIQTT